MKHDLNEMAIFAAVAEQQSFTKAALKLSMPKSSVSRHVSQLELRLGERLLNRTTRQLKLTEVGKLYFRHCRRVVEEIESAESAVSSLQQEPTGRLRVSAPLAFGAPLLQHIFSDFLEIYPKIEMELILDNRLVDLLEEEIDLAIRVGPLQDSSLVARTFGKSALCFCATPEFLEKYGEPVTPDDLENFQLVCHPTIPLELSNGELIEVKSRFKVNDMSIVAACALQHLGIGILPLPMVQEDIKNGRLKPILLDFPLQTKEFYLVYPSRQLASKTIVFIDFLFEQMKHMNFWNVTVQEFIKEISAEYEVMQS